MVGDPDELFYVGICFETEMGLARSAQSTFHYYEQASKLGYPSARQAVDRCRPSMRGKKKRTGDRYL